MTDKKRNKEIKRVIKKYTKFFSRRKANAMHSIVSLSMGGAVLATDVFLTAGIGTLTLAATAFFGLGALSAYDTVKSTDKIRKNKADQYIQSNERISLTLGIMQYKLRTAFNKASHREASQKDKDNFLKLSKEIKEDLKTISPAFKIVDGGAAGFGKDEAIFILAERFTGQGEKRLITLQAAIEEINGTSKPSISKTHAKKERPKGGFGL